jgi:hypothetical protein
MINVYKNHSYLCLLILLVLTACSDAQRDDSHANDYVNYKFSHGYYAGMLTLFSDSIWYRGDYILIVRYLNKNDTVVGSYTIESNKNVLVGTAITGYPGILFSVYPGLDSGYLFDEPTIILRSIVN